VANIGSGSCLPPSVAAADSFDFDSGSLCGAARVSDVRTSAFDVGRSAFSPSCRLYEPESGVCLLPDLFANGRSRL
jgi:hypothetical protein